MIHAPIQTSRVNYSSPVLLEQCLLNSSLETNINPNCKAAMSKDSEIRSKSNNSKVSMVNKTYEMHNGALCESYFDISDVNEAKDFIDDYALNICKSLILVINSGSQIEEVLNSSSGIRNCIKLIISYNNVFSHLHLSGIPQIIANSVKDAVNEAYKRVENGQSIIFTRVGSNFDLFAHMENV